MSVRLIALISVLALTACADTPERQSLDEFNATVGTVNRTVSTVNTIGKILR